MRSAIVFALLSTLGACATTTDAAYVAPAWASEPSRAALSGASQRVILGIGNAQDVTAPRLAQTLAENRARADVARIFDGYTQALVQAYVKHAGEEVAQGRVGEILHRLATSALPLAAVTASQPAHARVELDVGAWLSALPEEPALLAEERAFFLAEGAEVFEHFVARGEWHAEAPTP